MNNAPEPKRFDIVAEIAAPDDDIVDCVFHRDAAGEFFAWHSPLTRGTISCTLCEAGARVYLEGAASE